MKILFSKKIILSLVGSFTFLLLISCSERHPIGRAADARYLEDGSNKGLVNLDKINAQDFTRAANQLIGDLLSSGALANAPTQPAILHVGEIRNDTQTYFDTDLLMQGMKRDLLATNRVRISTTAGPGGRVRIVMRRKFGRIWKEKESKLIDPDPIFPFLVRLSKRRPGWKK